MGLAMLFPARAHAQSWYDAAWTSRQKITIQSGVTDADLANFPLLVRITDAGNPIFGKAQSDGDDILFTAADGTTKLDHEIEFYDDGTSNLEAWVRIPSLSTSIDNEIYLYYENGTVGNQQNPTAVWDSDFVMVQHLDETSGTHFDATTNGNNGTPLGGVTQAATGQIDGADSFDGSNDYINIPNSTSLQVTEMTLEAWIYVPDPIPSGFHGILQHAYNTSNWYGLWLAGSDPTFHFRWSTGSVRRTDFITQIASDTWYHVVGVLDVGADRAYGYIDGSLDVTVTGPDAPTPAFGSTIIGAALSGPSEWFDGIIDEVRISRIARSAEWIEASYRNQGQPESYQSEDPEEVNATTAISSTTDQAFWVGKAPSAISPILVWEGEGAAAVTAANDIRIRIPASFAMSWDTLDVAATIGGTAAAKVSSTVGYEDAGKTLVLDVTTDFGTSDTITIADLGFADFTATSGTDNLELEVNNAGTVAAEDDKTIEILPGGTPILSSELDQSFRVGDPPVSNSTITVRADAAAPTITAANDIRIRIPFGFNMTWDTSDVTALILGTGSAKVSNTVSYEDGGRTLVIDVLTDFDPGDLITISELSFANFTAASLDDNLELEVRNDGQVSAYDDKVVFIVLILVTPDIHSSRDQFFTVGDPSTPNRAIRVTDDDDIPQVTAANDIRIRIPAGLDMVWDVTDGTAQIGAKASQKVSSSVTYEDGGKTLVLDVTTDFVAGDWISVRGLSYTTFSSAGAPGRLELEVYNDGSTSSIDGYIKRILGSIISVDVWPDTVRDSRLPGSGSNYTVDFTVSNLGNTTDDYDLLASVAPGTAITVTSITGVGVSQGASPDSARLSDLSAGESGIVTIAYSVADVADGTVDTLRLVARSVTSPAQSNDGRLILNVAKPVIASAANQVFGVGDPPTPASPITVTDALSAPTITALHDLRIRIPVGFNMTWDTGDVAAAISGPASSKVSSVVSYEDGGHTLVVDVTADFAAGDAVTIDQLSFTGFAASSAPDSLELEVANDGLVSATDDKSIEIRTPGPPSISSAANQLFDVGSVPVSISAITVVDDALQAAITAANDIRIRIPVGFAMLWDSGDGVATLGGSAAAKVSTTVSYEDSDGTLVLDVLTDFSPGDQITISDVSFVSFTATAAPDNLELEVDDDGVVSATDDKTIAIQNQPGCVADPVTSVTELRAALLDSDCNPINIVAGTYLLTSDGNGQLEIERAVTIRRIGFGEVVLDAGAASEVFEFKQDVAVTMDGLTIQNGSRDSGAGVRMNKGGATLTLMNSTVRSNTGKQGAGLFIQGTLVLERSTVSGNTAPDAGGAGIFVDGGTFTCINSTISGNTATQKMGGGLHMKGGSTTTLTNCTIAENQAEEGGGIWHDGDAVTLRNTIVADNTTTVTGNQIDGNAIVSNGYNLVEGGCSGCTGSDLTADPVLGSLTNNGGDTETQALLSGSPALNAALDGDAPATDQRGIARPQGASSDIGAYEKLPEPPGANVTPDGAQNLEHLPSNGTDYTTSFTVLNDGTGADDFLLTAFAAPGGTLNAVSVNGVAGDTTTITLAAGDSLSVDVVYSVADVAAGTADSLYLRARAGIDTTVSDTGFADVLVVRPIITTTKAVAPVGAQLPGTDLTYTSTLTNSGTEVAVDVIWVESLPAEVEFQVGSVATSFPAGIGVVVEFSDDDGAGWTYTPTDQACSAPAGYDGCLTDIRWTLQDPLSATAPDNVGTMEYVARIK